MIIICLWQGNDTAASPPLFRSLMSWSKPNTKSSVWFPYDWGQKSSGTAESHEVMNCLIMQGLGIDISVPQDHNLGDSTSHLWPRLSAPVGKSWYTNKCVSSCASHPASNGDFQNLDTAAQSIWKGRAIHHLLINILGFIVRAQIWHRRILLSASYSILFTLTWILFPWKLSRDVALYSKSLTSRD